MQSSAKHFLGDDPSSITLASLRGLCAVNPQLGIDPSNKVVYTHSHNRQHVALLCGGGSGHEPAHSAFVGAGMLTGAVSGNIFASPSAKQVRRGIDLVENDKGTVIIVKNYTGDVLNFGLAREQYAALHPEKADRVKFVVVGDDVAVGKTQSNVVGRRGLAGTVLVYKIAGALARRRGSLEDVFHLAQWVSNRIVTVGVGLEHCHVPGTATLPTQLAPNEIEIGLGIHGEAGHRRVSPIPSLQDLIRQLLEMLTSTTDKERSYLPFRCNGEDRVVVLINNLGGMSELELGGVVAEVRQSLEEIGISIMRLLSGTFMTSLNMPGFSVTLLLLPSPTDTSSPTIDILLSLLDAETDAPGWKWSSRSPPRDKLTVTPVAPATARQVPASNLRFPNPKRFTHSIERACRALIAAEPEITRFDSIVGDADCGITLKSGATAVLARVIDGQIVGTDVIGAVMTVAQVAEEYMGGSSGALYSIFFTALAQGLQASQHGGELAEATKDVWAGALTAAINKLYTYTKARPPSRTLVDPLCAFVGAISRNFCEAVSAARVAAEATRDMDAKAGRSVYLDAERLRKEGIPDPGAWGVIIILESL